MCFIVRNPFPALYTKSSNEITKSSCKTSGSCFNGNCRCQRCLANGSADYEGYSSGVGATHFEGMEADCRFFESWKNISMYRLF